MLIECGRCGCRRSYKTTSCGTQRIASWHAAYFRARPKRTRQHQRGRKDVWIYALAKRLVGPALALAVLTETASEVAPAIPVLRGKNKVSKSGLSILEFPGERFGAANRSACALLVIQPNSAVQLQHNSPLYSQDDHQAVLLPLQLLQISQFACVTKPDSSALLKGRRLCTPWRPRAKPRKLELSVACVRADKGCCSMTA